MFFPCIDNFIAFSSCPRSTDSLKPAFHHSTQTLKTSEVLARRRKGDTFKPVHTAASAASSLANTADTRKEQGKGAQGESVFYKQMLPKGSVN